MNPSTAFHFPEPVLTGFGHTRFGRHDDATLESMLRDASTPAQDARLDANDLDMEMIATHNHGFVPQRFAAGLSGLIDEGWVYRDGKLPVNVSAGRKARRHPIGATGESMHVMASLQLLGRAGALRLPQPELAGVFNMGGMGVSNCVSMLERAS